MAGKESANEVRCTGEEARAERGMEINTEADGGRTEENKDTAPPGGHYTATRLIKESKAI